MSKPQLPDFILVGAPRCATTWLHECLLDHPDIFLPDCKELNFFCSNHWDNDYERHGLEYYRSFFFDAGEYQVIGDISPNNMWDTRSAERIHSDVPNAKILVLLRNPVDRAWSHYNYIINRTIEPPNTFAEVIDGQWWTSGIIEQGHYAAQLGPYLRLFPEDRILIVLYEEIKSAPEETFDRICTFVGARPGIRPRHLRTRRNRPHGQRLTGLYKANLAMARALSRLGLDSVRRAVKRTGVPRLLKRLNRVPVPSPVLPEAQRKALSRLYGDDIAELAELLSRDLSAWVDD